MATTTSKTSTSKAVSKAAAPRAKPAAKKPVAKSATTGVKPAAAKPPVAKATAATAKPVVKPAASKKPAAVKPPPVARAQVTKPLEKITPKAMVVSDEQRYRMVAEAAYYRAESNQFKSDPLRDWIEAESDITALLSGSK